MQISFKISDEALKKAFIEGRVWPSQAEINVEPDAIPKKYRKLLALLVTPREGFTAYLPKEFETEGSSPLDLYRALDKHFDKKEVVMSGPVPLTPFEMRKNLRDWATTEGTYYLKLLVELNLPWEKWAIDEWVEGRIPYGWSNFAKYQGWNEMAEIGNPPYDVLKALKEAREEFVTAVIYLAREGNGKYHLKMTLNEPTMFAQIFYAYKLIR